MQGRPILYNGKPIDKKHFKVYIYQDGGIQKLVNSYEEYEAHLSNGLWFSSIDDIPKASKKAKESKKSNPDIEETKIEHVNDSLSDAAQSDRTFEKKDGFLDRIKGA